MAKKKIIAVVGATGAQGGGLVRAILGDPSGMFAARAITRNVNSDKAKDTAPAFPAESESETMIPTRTNALIFISHPLPF